MNSIQIEYFIEVVKCQSFSKAARNLYVSQPTVSRQIAALEEELNLPLFDRTTGGTTLNESGLIMYDLFLHVQKEIDETVKALQQKNAKYIELKFGVLEGWEVTALANRLTESFAASWPSVRITFVTYPFHLLIEQLLSGKLDAILCIENYLQDNRKIEIIRLTQIESILLCSSLHPLAGKADLGLSDFKDEPYYTLPKARESGARDFYLNFLRLNGVQPLTVELPNMDSILFALCKNIGYTLFDEWCRAKDLPAYKHLPVDMRLDVCFAHAKSNSNIFVQMCGYHLLNLLTQNT